MIMDCTKYIGPCSCGRDHQLETKMVVVDYDALSHFEEYMQAVGLGGPPAGAGPGGPPAGAGPGGPPQS